MNPMVLIAQVEAWIERLATQVPLEVFAFVGSFIEELIAPIPSPLVMTTAGALALIDERTWLFILWLSLIGAVGKTLGAWLYYVAGDKFEDYTLRKFGSWLGIRHEDVESIGQRFGKNHWKDGSVLLVLRVLPFIPGAIISFGSGVIKLNIRVYLSVSFVGNFLKDLMYASTGFAGVSLLQDWWRDADRIRLGLDVAVGVAILAFLVILYINREKGVRWLSRLVDRYRV